MSQSLEPSIDYILLRLNECNHLNIQAIAMYHNEEEAYASAVIKQLQIYSIHSRKWSRDMADQQLSRIQDICRVMKEDIDSFKDRYNYLSSQNTIFDTLSKTTFQVLPMERRPSTQTQAMQSVFRTQLRNFIDAFEAKSDEEEDLDSSDDDEDEDEDDEELDEDDEEDEEDEGKVYRIPIVIPESDEEEELESSDDEVEEVLEPYDSNNDLHEAQDVNNDSTEDNNVNDNEDNHVNINEDNHTNGAEDNDANDAEDNHTNGAEDDHVNGAEDDHVDDAVDNHTNGANKNGVQNTHNTEFSEIIIKLEDVSEYSTELHPVTAQDTVELSDDDSIDQPVSRKRSFSHLEEEYTDTKSSRAKTGDHSSTHQIITIEDSFELSDEDDTIEQRMSLKRSMSQLEDEEDELDDEEETSHKRQRSATSPQ
ncbi:hypothetical protein BDB01DRAFT_835908 [Pilobolus umbonatus]|nr:hypothetical protein BDB01DRAFT_835908 [Pilobolus umbonatus]